MRQRREKFICLSTKLWKEIKEILFTRLNKTFRTGLVAFRGFTFLQLISRVEVDLNSCKSQIFLLTNKELAESVKSLYLIDAIKCDEFSFFLCVRATSSHFQQLTGPQQRGGTNGNVVWWLAGEGWCHRVLSASNREKKKLVELSKVFSRACACGVNAQSEFLKLDCESIRQIIHIWSGSSVWLFFFLLIENKSLQGEIHTCFENLPGRTCSNETPKQPERP